MEVYQSMRDVPHALGNALPTEDDMDIDVDMDLDLDPVDGLNEVQSLAEEQSITAIAKDHTEEISESATHDDVVPEKIHLRGLDDLTTEDILVYCSEHFPTPSDRIEWINDTSANIVYSSPIVATSALANITLQSADLPAIISDTAIRPAKPFTLRPDSHLHVRKALQTDRKPLRAHEKSRFYLLHPEHDSRERRRRYRELNHSAKTFNRRRYSNEEDSKRKRNVTMDGFDASMCDDGPVTSPTASFSPNGRFRRKVDSYRPSRNRSASPEEHRARSHSGYRRRSPFSPHKLPDRHATARANKDKELLPAKARVPIGRDLFSHRLLADKSSIEPFPNKTPLSNHRRTDAFDAADETADLFAGKFSVPFTDGANDAKCLAARITRPGSIPSTSANPQRTNARAVPSGLVLSENMNEGLSIRGASDTGLSIKGASHIGTVKELFPSKANVGKELFAKKLQGRGGPRMRAEDLFS